MQVNVCASVNYCIRASVIVYVRACICYVNMYVCMYVCVCVCVVNSTL